MKIIDSFMFFDENMLLDLRLNILDNYVSKFIVCESTYSHSGKKKKLNFDINNFPKFRSKIEYIVSDKEPDNLKKIKNEDSIALKESKTLDNALIRENFQRNFAHEKLLEVDDNDLILINDLDEIPDLSNFSYQKKITIFKQKMLYFKLNLIYKNLSWTGSKICKKKDFINPQWLRNIKTRKYPSAPDITKGPFTITNETTKLSTRARGRQMAMKLESSGTEDDWQLGDFRINTRQDGLR